MPAPRRATIGLLSGHGGRAPASRAIVRVPFPPGLLHRTPTCATCTSTSSSPSLQSSAAANCRLAASRDRWATTIVRAIVRARHRSLALCRRGGAGVGWQRWSGQAQVHEMLYTRCACRVRPPRAVERAITRRRADPLRREHMLTEATGVGQGPPTAAGSQTQSLFFCCSLQGPCRCQQPLETVAV